MLYQVPRNIRDRTIVSLILCDERKRHCNQRKYRIYSKYSIIVEKLLKIYAVFPGKAIILCT